jgi:Tol biopolymer transport system component
LIDRIGRRPGGSPGRRFALFVLVLTASLVVACGGGNDPRLVFDSERDGDDDIYLMSPDGSDVRQLTNEQRRDYEPDASPDGKRIVFASQRASGDSSQLHLMDVDGTNVRRLTFGADNTEDRVLDDYAEWSPDGTRIAFQRTTIPESGRPDADIWLLDPETGEETALTDAPDVWDSTPTFTVDGRAVIFESNRSGTFELYRQPLDGGEAVRLTETDGNDAEAKESPDGSLIAFVSDQDGDFDVYLMDPDGGNVRALTSAEGNDRCPQWSPDGKRIAFSSERDGNPEIYVMNADGSDPRRLTDTPAAEEVADWVRR